MWRWTFATSSVPVPPRSCSDADRAAHACVSRLGLATTHHVLWDHLHVAIPIAFVLSLHCSNTVLQCVDPRTTTILPATDTSNAPSIRSLPFVLRICASPASTPTTYSIRDLLAHVVLQRRAAIANSGASNSISSRSRSFSCVVLSQSLANLSPSLQFTLWFVSFLLDRCVSLSISAGTPNFRQILSVAPSSSTSLFANLTRSLYFSLLPPTPCRLIDKAMAGLDLHYTNVCGSGILSFCNNISIKNTSIAVHEDVPFSRVHFDSKGGQV